MKKNLIKISLLAALFTGSLSSCTKKLDLLPTNDITAVQVYSTPAGYKQSLAKVYGAFALTGNSGPGNVDIQGIPEDNTDFFRNLFITQVLSTDESVVAWGDGGLQEFHNMNWSTANPFLKGMYYRSLYQITLANDFIRQSTDAQLSSRGISGTDADNIRHYRTEARFLRAYQYWVLMDLFANPPFLTEKDIPGTGALPTQINRKDLFAYLESELKGMEGDLVAARQNEYGRADKAAAWALLARLYLNAQVYTGTARYSEAITYAKKVIEAGYSLVSDYRWMMLADNHLNSNEFILTINYDGLHTRGYGGTTFMTHASVGGSMPADKFGVNGGWWGIRSTKSLVNLFPDANGTTDKRAQFWTPGQDLEINSITNFTEGYGVTKFRNVKRDGTGGQDLTFADIDIPIFRLAEMYLIYAEAVVRGGTGGDMATAVQYINQLRQRAYGNTSGNIASGQLTTDFLLNERGRELYWEGFRRTDLIRYGRFTEGTYLWPWKGGVKGGKGVEAFRNLYPLPIDEVTSNPNLKQNTGY